jgi:hypothetical protein
MDFELHDPDVGRDGFVEELYAARFRAEQAERELELDAKIAMGWGTTKPEHIPADWMFRYGPDTEARRAAYRNAHQGHGRGGRTANENKSRRLMEAAAARRAKRLQTV